jgi:iron complex transport system ATP-binding protein
MARRPQAPLVETEGLAVRRGRHSLLRSIGWRVEAGQHWVILGANGSGKTSLLSALCGYLTPTSGRLSVCGHAYGRYDWRDLRKEIGLVSSSIRQQIQEGFTALEIAASGPEAVLNAHFRRNPARERRARAALRRVGAGPLAGHDWAWLSQGERQRVLIARALLADFKLLILDEPCAGLDPAAREQFLAFLQRFGRAPRAPTLVLVTHHVEEIMPCFTHVLVLRKGRVLASGRKTEVLTPQVLSRAFDSPARLHRSKGRYRLHLAPRASRVL